MTELVCLSNFHHSHPQTDYSRGYITFALPYTHNSLQRKRVALHSLNFKIDPDITDWIVVYSNGNMESYIFDMKNSATEYIEEINRTLAPWDVRLMEEEKTTLFVPHTVNKVSMSRRLATCLGFCESVFHETTRAEFRRDISAGLSPLIVCAPRLVQSSHITDNNYGDILAVIPQYNPANHELSIKFDGNESVPIISGQQSDLALQLCTPAYPDGLPMKHTQIFATLRFECLYKL